MGTITIAPPEERASVSYVVRKEVAGPRLKMVIYSHYFAPSIGGVETSVEALATGLAKYEKLRGSLEFDTVVITNTPLGEFEDFSLPFPVVRNPSMLELLRLIWKAQVIHLAGPALLPLLLARIFRKPIVVEHHGYLAICPNGSLLHEPDRTVCPGHFQAGRLDRCFRCRRSELSSGLKSLRSLVLTIIRNALCRGVENIAVSAHLEKRQALPNSHVIYHGVPDPLSDKNTSSPVSRSDAKLCFAYVGRFISEKGILILLKAAARLQEEGREFEVLLIGDGPERTKLEGEIQRQRLGSRIHITGFLRGPELVSTLAKVDVVVMPSVWEETAGLSAIEQMMRGRLVIASDIGGLGEVVGSAGMVCPPGDAEALAACMAYVIVHPECLATLGNKAREHALTTFRYTRMLEDHAEVYRRVFSGRRALHLP
jgi:glycosyltransferase involved in cell wall biosynthesis